MEKIVTSGEQDCTVELDGTECAVVFSSNYRCFTVQNETADDIYISVSPNISAGKDGVRRIGAGASGAIAHGTKNTLYILGSGSVQVTASDSPGNFFKPAPAAGGGEAVDAYTKSESDARYPLITDVVPYKMGMDFGTCTTAAETIQKTVTTLNKIAPTVGAVFAIKFTNAVPAQARLSVNGVSGYIQYRGASLPAGIINSDDVVTFMYYKNTGFIRFEILSIENGGNAATVGGVGIANLRQITQTVLNTLPAVPNGEGDFLVNCDTSDTSFPYWYGHLSIRYGSYTGEYVAIFRTTGNDNKVYYNTYLTNHWSGWQEISATPIKSTQISGTTNDYGDIIIFSANDNKKIISAEWYDHYCVPFISSDGNYYVHAISVDGTAAVNTKITELTVYYAESKAVIL